MYDVTIRVNLTCKGSYCRRLNSKWNWNFLRNRINFNYSY